MRYNGDKMSGLISVIVPAYNAAKTIRRCAKSILAQTDDNFEVLFINDGSKDNTGEILEQICSERKNFHLITIKNSGAAMARNIGIDKAKGDYICFVDADDIISPNYLKKMRELMVENDADVVCTKYARNKTDNFEKISERSEAMRGGEAINALLQMNIDNGPFAKLFSRKVIGKIKMPNVAVAEDLYFNYGVFKHATKVIVNDSVLYAYIESKGSLSTKFSTERMGSLVAVKKIDAEENSFYSMARLFMEAYFICELIILAKGAKEYAVEYETVCDILKKTRKKILNDSRATKRQRLIAAALRFGPTFTVRLMTAKSRIKRKTN